ncbi:MAG: RsmB/NOP family class I SAM-dependent RNA methyltransferase [Anaeromyxobacteraceae bacterium]
MATAAAASERRLEEVPWRALAGLAPALEPALSAVLAGAAAERVVDRFLRAHRGLDADGRRAAKEAIYGVAVWRRRLAYHASFDSAPLRGATLRTNGGGDPFALSVAAERRSRSAAPSPLVLLAALLRDLAGVPAAEALLALPAGTLPPPRPRPPDLATRYSLPDWLAATLVGEVGPTDAPALADALNLPGPICFRPNALRTSPAALAGRLAADGVATHPGALLPSALLADAPLVNVHGLAAWREGLLEVQDEASQLAGALVGARPGETVLDLCAGAGGKALQLAAAVGGGGAVHACDVDAARLDRLATRAGRAGASDIVRVQGAAPPAQLRVDRAIVDAPCSELGALRRGPDLRFRLDPSGFAALPPVQLALLSRAAEHVRAGGRLVYVTCTFRREEDEDVALGFERDHPLHERIVPDAPGAALTGEGFLRTWPHRDGCDGFFAAVWQRRA